MQKIILSFFISLILISCGSESNNVDDPNPSDTTLQSLENYPMDPDSELVEQSVLFSSIVTDFPKHWVKVDVQKDKKVHHVLCGMDSPSLKIEKVDDHWEILTNYGQGAESWHLINMTSKFSVFNEQELQEGIFVAQKISYPDDEFYEVSYFWNKTAGFCTFGDFFSADAKFAEFDKMDEFEVIKEPCDQ